MTNYQIAEIGEIKETVYAMINNGERGVLISDFEAVKEVCEKIVLYIYEQRNT